MPQATANLKLVDSLAQIILTLSSEERRLLEKKIQISQMDLNLFFADECVFIFGMLDLMYVYFLGFK